MLTLIQKKTIKMMFKVQMMSINLLKYQNKEDKEEERKTKRKTDQGRQYK